MNYIKILLLFILAFVIVKILDNFVKIIVTILLNFVHDKRRKNSKYCNYCRLKYEKSWKFCGICGRELGNKLYVKRCLECDYSTDDFNEFFCPHCNEDLKYFEVEEDE